MVSLEMNVILAIFLLPISNTLVQCVTPRQLPNWHLKSVLKPKLKFKIKKIRTLFLQWQVILQQVRLSCYNKTHTTMLILALGYSGLVRSKFFTHIANFYGHLPHYRKLLGSFVSWIVAVFMNRVQSDGSADWPRSSCA